MNNRVIFAILAMVLSLSVHAQSSINDVLRAGDLTVSSHLSKERNVAVGEQIKVIIDLETSTWFTKGTEIKRFSVDNAIVLMENANVVNSTVRRKGKTYSTQRWEIPLYPLTSGSIHVAPISVSVSFKGESGNVVGTISTRPMQLNAYLASENMSPETTWLVADDVVLKETLTYVSQNDDEIKLSVGDSVTRTVHIKGQGTSSMLIPDVIHASDEATTARSYLSSPKRSDKQIRGETTATYEQSVTFILAQPGVVNIPEIKLLWWNPNTQSEKWLTLPSHEWEVSHTPMSFLQTYWVEILVAVVGGVAMMYGITLAIRELNIRDKEGRLPLFIQFNQAVYRKQRGKAESIIYRQLLKQHHSYTLISSSSETSWNRDAERLQQTYREQRRAINETKTLKRIWRKVSG